MKPTRSPTRKNAVVRMLLALLLIPLSPAPPLNAQGSVSFVPAPGR